MDSKQIIEREQHYGRTAGILGIIGVLVVLLPILGGLASDFNRLSEVEYAARYEAFDSISGQVFASQVLIAIGVLLFVPPLLFLFQAAMYRSSAVRRQLMALTVIGPLLFAIAMVLLYVAYDQTVSTFLDSPQAAAGGDDFAKTTLNDSVAYQAFTSLRLASILTIAIIVVYTSLQAMRAGLLTRFVGTLGMAVGVISVLSGPGPLLGIFIIVVSFLIAGWWRGPRPPAWETGEAIPWPKPGELPDQPPEEPASPADFEGSARELDDEEDGAEDDYEEPGRPTRRDNRRKRKRKQRG